MGSLKVYNTFFEDDNGDKIFFYCGKSSVLGLSHPDYYFKNTKNYTYARLAFLHLIDTGDDQLTTYLNETITVNLISAEEGTTYSILAPIGLCATDSSNNELHLSWGVYPNGSFNDKYNVYVDGVKVLSKVIVGNYKIDGQFQAGMHYCAVTRDVEGRESSACTADIMVTGSYNTGSPTPATKPDYSTIGQSIDSFRSFNVHVEALGKAGHIIRNSVRCTVENESTVESDQNIIISCTEETDNVDSTMVTGLGIWVNIEAIKYVLIAAQHSLAANSSPIDATHIASSYKIDYLSNDTVVENVNTLISGEKINRNLILNSTPKNVFVESRLAAIESKLQYLPFSYSQRSVNFQLEYQPTEVDIYEDLIPSSVNGTYNENFVTLDTIQKGFKVSYDGIYLIQVKNGLVSIDGNSCNSEVVLYNGSAILPETLVYNYLESAESETSRKINTISSNIMMYHLRPTDILKLKAKVSGQVQCINNCIVTITMIQRDYKK